MPTELTHALLRQLLHYDPATGVFTWTADRRGRFARAGAKAGTVDKRGYVSICILQRIYLAHRVAWFYMTGQWPTHQIDHEDTIRDHNWIDNLRPVTNAINQQNHRKAFRTNRTGFLGVRPNGNCFQALIGLNGETRILGNFPTPQEAHQAYLAAKRQLHQGNTL